MLGKKNPGFGKVEDEMNAMPLPELVFDRKPFEDVPLGSVLAPMVGTLCV
jgi:hypothetical protein